MDGKNNPSLKLLKDIKIVLVGTTHPGNIGGAARAMKTMNLSELVLVNPKEYPDPRAVWRAAGAQDVLSKTLVVKSPPDLVYFTYSVLCPLSDLVATI